MMWKFNEAIDEIRRAEVMLFKANRQANILERGRWLLLKRPENLSEKQTARMDELFKLNLPSAKPAAKKTRCAQTAFHRFSGLTAFVQRTCHGEKTDNPGTLNPCIPPS